MSKKQFYTGALLLLLLLAVGRQSNAQFKDNPEFNIWSAQPGDTFRVLLRIANVRSEPGTDAAILDSLVCGTPVILGERSGFDGLRGIYVPWHKVRYQHQGRFKEGYIWLGTLALGSSTDSLGNCFLYGLDHIEERVNNDSAYEATWRFSVKVVNGDLKLLDERKIALSNPEISATGGKLLGDMGLQRLQNIYRFYFSGEACGVPTYYYYYGWDGVQLLNMPGKMEVGDAGIYYHTETLLFPKEHGGKPDSIIKVIVEAEAIDDKVDKNGDPVLKETRSRETYLWDGIRAKKL
jgi:hypothetical protein